MASSSGSKAKGQGGGISNPFAGQDIVKILSLSGGALVGAAGLFGVKKIYDYWTSGPVRTVSSHSLQSRVATPVTTPEFLKCMPGMYGSND